MKRVVVLQSNYIPWKGYFDLMRRADEFIFYDEVQYTKGDWRNRNLIKTAEGKKWLTIPVGDSLKRKVSEVQLPQSNWKNQHRKTIHQFYKDAPAYKHALPLLDKLYSVEAKNLSEFNQAGIKIIAGWLEIKTRFSDSVLYGAVEGDRNQRLIKLLKKTGATHYLCGPISKNYLDEDAFISEGITVEYFDYTGYPEYPQLYPPFDHHVSILDLIINTGEKALDYFKS
jgi:hypothetical protein